MERIIKGDDIIERAYEELNRFSWNEEELLTYDQSEKCYNSYIATIENKYEEGIEKGREEGIEKGLKKGREEGIEESKLIIAKNMLKTGINEKTINQVTGLFCEQIKALK